MAERLVIVSDMRGSKKGLWLTSYLGYLQQYFDVAYYDSQKLADIDLPVDSEKKLHNAFINGGMDTAVEHLLKRQKVPCHYLAFSIGGTIVWKAGLKGLPMKSFYAVSATRIRLESEKPNVPTTLLYGSLDMNRPYDDWFSELSLDKEVILDFGHELYSDKKIIEKVCLDLLRKVTVQRDLAQKVV